MKSDRKPLRLLGNARRLLDLIAEEGPLTSTRLAELLEMPRSTVFRLAEGLAAVELLTVRPNGTIDLASRWLRLADVAQDSRTEWQPARRLLAELAKLTECTTVLCVYHDGGAMCLDWVPGKVNEVLQAKPGRQLPLHAGAEGRSILSALPDDHLDRYLAGAPFEAFTPRTMITATELRGDIAQTRRQGVVVSLEDAFLGLGSIGLAVSEPERGTLGSISVTSVSDEIWRRHDELIETLLTTAAKYQ